jgi:hypothetical protein
MKVICQNCHMEFETNNPVPEMIAMCPFCGAPYVQNGIGVTWG